MTIEATEKRYFGLRVQKRVVNPGEVIHIDPIDVKILSADTLALTTDSKSGFRSFLKPRILIREQINRLFEKPLSKSIGSTISLSWKP